MFPMDRPARLGSAVRPMSEEVDGNFPEAKRAFAMSDPIIKLLAGFTPTPMDGEVLVLVVEVLLALIDFIEFGTFGTSKLTRSRGVGAVTGTSGTVKTLLPFSLLPVTGQTISRMKPHRIPSLWSRGNLDVSVV